MADQDNETGYHAYLLRLWQADGRGQGVWRASLTDSSGEERHLFADLRQLFIFLEQETAWRPAAPGSAAPDCAGD